MRAATLLLSLALAAAIPQSASAQSEIRDQFKINADKTMKDYVNDGYELKAAIFKGGTDYDYFLQKGNDLVLCTETKIRPLKLVFCSVLVQPHRSPSQQ